MRLGDVYKFHARLTFAFPKGLTAKDHIGVNKDPWDGGPRRYAIAGTAVNYLFAKCILGLLLYK